MAEKKTGIMVSGQVSEVSSYTNAKGVTYFSVILFIPGSELMKISLAGQPDPARFPTGDNVQLRVNMQKFKDGNINFKEAH